MLDSNIFMYMTPLCHIWTNHKTMHWVFNRKGFLTYVEWSRRAFPYSIDYTQHFANQECIDRFGHDWSNNKYRWISVQPYRTASEFVQRAIASFTKQMPSASELTKRNFLFLGKSLDSNEHALLIDRLWRRTHGPGNRLVKPIYKPSHVSKTRVHYNWLSKGRSINLPVDQLCMNH